MTDKEMTTTLAIALPLVCVAVLFGIVVFLIYRRIRKNGESSTGKNSYDIRILKRRSSFF